MKNKRTWLVYVVFGVLILAFIVTGLLTGCSSVIVRPNDDSMCPAACEHLRELACIEGEPLSDGTTCEVFCSYNQKNGHDLNPGCLAEIPTCADQERCSR